jgi:hypothetical protein
LPARAGGQRRAGGGQTSRRTGWLAGGGGALGLARLGSAAPSDRNTRGCRLGKRPLGNLLLCLLSLWAALSLHRTVFCSPPPAIPAVCSQPAGSAHPSSSASAGPLLLPISASLENPLPNVCVCLSVGQRGLSGHRRGGWDSSPCSLASRDQQLLQHRREPGSKLWVAAVGSPSVPT